MSNQSTSEDPKKFDAPPPPPAETSDDAQDIGLATEMVFSGKRRQELRDGAAYETLQTGEIPSEDDEGFYDDVEVDEDATAEHSTELLLTENHADLREAVQQVRQDNPSVTVYSEESQQHIGNYRTVSFDPKQQPSYQPGTTSQQLAFTMLVVFWLIALGIFSVLALLIYRLLTGT